MSETDPLVERARAAALRAYAPYSGFGVGRGLASAAGGVAGARRACARVSGVSVGGAIESVDGEIAVGSNMENACYRLGVCAELAALTAAKQAFGLDRIARTAVAGGHVRADGSLGGSAVVTPCGGCRQ